MERLSHALLGEPQDREQLVSVLRNAQQRYLLDPEALGMIEGVLQVAEMQARDIMIPRAQMVVLQRDDAPEELLSTVVESGHSRFPVIGENRDEVLGILLAKDLLRYFSQGTDKTFQIADIIRPTVFVPESKRLNILLKEFRSSRNHIAIVVNEYRGVAGMVTLEDVLEQIVGEIEDEYDIDADVFIVKHGDNRYTAKALTPIDVFNEQFNADFSDEEFDTLGGLVLHGFGHLPKRNESITIGRFRFKILRADNRRIYLLQVIVLAVNDGENRARDN